MFYTYLGGAFIVELLVGIFLGWSLALLHLRRKESLEKALTDQSARDPALNRSNGSGMSGQVGMVQTIAQDRSSVEMRVQQLGNSLAETQTLYERVNSELQSTREALAQSEATSSGLYLQVQGFKGELAEGESKNAALQSQVNYFQKSAADAQTLIDTLNETTHRLQSDLDEAEKTRERLNMQLSVYKEKMHVAIAQLERTRITTKTDVSA